MPRHKVLVEWVGDEVREWLPETHLTVKDGDEFSVGQRVSANWPEKSARLYAVDIIKIVEEDEDDRVEEESSVDSRIASPSSKKPCIRNSPVIGSEPPGPGMAELISDLNLVTADCQNRLRKVNRELSDQMDSCPVCM